MKQIPSRFKCPSCWEYFHLEETLWIAVSEELSDQDERVKHQALRFLPKRFTHDCDAIDAHGEKCHEIACPHCHLSIPRAYLETFPFSISTVGARTSGKTFFLISMMWWIARELPNYGIYSYDHAPKNNHFIKSLVATAFPENPNEQDYFSIGFTQSTKDNAETVFLPSKNANSQEEKEVVFKRPFIYTLVPKKNTTSTTYSLCLYDNAGEDFVNEGYSDNYAEKFLLTGHLQDADTVFFLFDPTQQKKFFDDYKDKSGGDKSIRTGAEENIILQGDMIEKYHNQASIFDEMTHRINKHFDATKRYDKTLIIVVSKSDVWQCLLSEETQEKLTKDPISVQNDQLFLDEAIIQSVSNDVHRLLLEYYRELVHKIDSFTENVIYIPVSATGCQPEKWKNRDYSEDTDYEPEYVDGFRQGSLEPSWIGVPLLYALANRNNPMVSMI